MRHRSIVRLDLALTDRLHVYAADLRAHGVDVRANDLIDAALCEYLARRTHATGASRDGTSPRARIYFGRPGRPSRALRDATRQFPP